MRILKHVKLINNVKLSFPKLRKLVDLFLLFSFRLLLLFDLSELQVDFVLDRAVPAPDLSIVEGGKDAALRIETSELERCHSGLRPMRDCVNAREEHVVFCGV